jgi:hypothetical protein
MSTASFVEQLYKNFLGRNAEADGKSYWVAQIDTGTLSASQVTRKFIQSPEFSAVVTPVVLLYYTALGRIPEASGLSYWVQQFQNGMTLPQINASFANSPEFQGKYVNLNNSAFLDKLYLNTFNRSADAVGKAGWLNGLDSLGMSRAEVVSGFAASAENIQARGESVKVVLEYHGILGTTPTQAQINIALSQNNYLDTIANLYANAQYKGVALPGLPAGQSISGTVIDGYIKGATVFADANNDGIWNPGEAMTTTDENGDFNLAGAMGSLVAYGGTDLMTNKAFQGVLTAPAGNTVVTPFTTLIQALVSGGLAATVEAATATVQKALSVPAGVNLLTYDALDVLGSSSASADAKSVALAVQSSAQQLANIVTHAGSTFNAASGVTTSTLQGAANTNAVTSALASAIAVAAASGTGTLDLSNIAVLTGVMQAAVTTAGVSGLAGQASQLAQVTSASNTVAAAATSITQLAQAAVVAQGSATNALIAGAASGNLSSAVSDFTGSNLASAVAAAQPGSIAPGIEVPAGTPAPNPAPTPGPTPTPTPTPTEIILVQKLDASPGNSGAATSYIAAGKQVTFHDDVSVASFASITGFGANDAIAFTAAAQSMLAISSQGSDVTLTANNNGLVSTIELKGVISPGQIVFDLTSFNALPAGDITFNGLEYPQNRSLDTAGGTLSNPALLDGANGSLLFIDDAAKASVVGITNFGTNDRLSMQNTLAQELAISSQDTNVTFVVNQAGTVSSVTLVGIVPVGVIVYDVNSFNALSVGDVQFQ